MTLDGGFECNGLITSTNHRHQAVSWRKVLPVKPLSIAYLVCFVLTYSGAALAAKVPSHCSVTLVRGENDVTELGSFNAKVAEEEETTETFAIPHTNLKAAVGVFYTDESIRIEVSSKYVQDNSIRVALAVGDTDEGRSLTSWNASVAEAALVDKTEEQNLLRVIKFIQLDGKKAAVVAECRER